MVSLKPVFGQNKAQFSTLAQRRHAAEFFHLVSLRFGRENLARAWRGMAKVAGILALQMREIFLIGYIHLY
jgi:hypothetical protein